MFRQYYSPILIFLLMNYSCKCQDLEPFVAPIVDNNGAPLVAIVNTTNISSHIVRSIEMPIRTIINSTVECKVNEKLKEDIVSSKVLGNVNNKFDALQQKMAEHIGENRKQLTGVKQDITTFRKEMEERITREILDKVGSLSSTVNTENKVMNEKLDSITATVNGMNLRVALSACVASEYTVSLSSTIKFPDVRTSVGITNQNLTSFKSSGVFVCEVPGLYHISVVIMSKTNYAYVKISKNDIELIRGNIDNYYTEHQLDYHSNAAIVVTELQKGDTIDIKPGNKDMRIDGDKYSCLTIVKVK